MTSEDDGPSTAPQEECRWELKPLEVVGFDATLKVQKEGMTIGRHPSNTVVLPQEEFPTVSANHTRLEARDGELVLLDLGSRNGTLLAGRRVSECVLKHGDVFQLGARGPRFMVAQVTGMDQTMTISTQEIKRPQERRSIGADTVAMVREEFGIPEHHGVDQMMHRQQRRTRLAVAALAIVIIGGGTWAYLALTKLGKSTEALAKEIEDSIKARNEAWQQHKDRLDKALAEWEKRREDLDSQRRRLENELTGLKSGGQATSAQLTALQERIDETKKQLQGYDPLNLEQTRLREVARVQKAVVLVEVEQRFVHKDSGRTLHIERTGTGRGSLLLPNFKDRGKPLVRRSNGSGFCFTKDGWILTNAHVVLKKDSDDKSPLTSGSSVTAEVGLKVVFSSTSERYEARLMAWASDGDQDLALIKIDPFPGMPFLPGIKTDAAMPELGSEVFVLGFPLGNEALQEGRKVIASTFRGIVSRSVGSYLQVDAAVHPGNSGGPLIDGRGRVLGVVVGMQRAGRDEASSAIGYIIPITEAKKLWPRPKKVAGK